MVLRLVLLLILMGCSQHSGNRMLVRDNGAGGATPPNCSTPSPLCPDMTDEESKKGGDDGKEGEESDKQPMPDPSESYDPQMPPAPIDYLSGNFKLNVSPASIPKNKEIELTITVSAIKDLELRSVDQNTGLHRTYDLWIGAQKASSTSKLPDTYRLDNTSTYEYFLGSKKPKCNINGRNDAWTQCKLKIKQMNKDDSFTITLKVKASEDFNIGTAKKINEEGEKESLTIKVN